MNVVYKFFNKPKVTRHKLGKYIVTITKNKYTYDIDVKANGYNIVMTAKFENRRQALSFVKEYLERLEKASKG